MGRWVADSADNQKIGVALTRLPCRLDDAVKTTARRQEGKEKDSVLRVVHQLEELGKIG
ncbi:hypothetical protein [Bradyrhizobium yuanmingense]|uniref:hypothetical protein n=1 Tax=Bradyrhizobium yuanmingense TaxID=108015 RepID=UPI0012FE4523|nr:hypothetical protein [Bradyrhizobium yuanmingense]MCA1530300.1 hypothetical protein [Bradyrhizobium yuanmingense]